MQESLPSNINFEHRKMLTISTSHLTKCDNEFLVSNTCNQFLEPYLLTYTYGFIIRRVMREVIDHFIEEGASQNLIAILEFSISNNFEILEIDRDGPNLSALSTYDWS